jgi:uncharacterized protein YjiS (DUF1127 family)
MRHYIPVPGTLFRRWRHYRKIHWELSQFNDRQLLDLGIRRTDINYVARAAAVEDDRLQSGIHSPLLDAIGEFPQPLTRHILPLPKDCGNSLTSASCGAQTSRGTAQVSCIPEQFGNAETFRSQQQKTRESTRCRAMSAPPGSSLSVFHVEES